MEPGYTVISMVIEMEAPQDGSNEEQVFHLDVSSIIGQVASNVRHLGVFQVPPEFILVIRQTMREEIKNFCDSGVICKGCKKHQTSGILQPYSSSFPSPLRVRTGPRRDRPDGRRVAQHQYWPTKAVQKEAHACSRKRERTVVAGTLILLLMSLLTGRKENFFQMNKKTRTLKFLSSQIGFF